jgi:hypothetical protein
MTKLDSDGNFLWANRWGQATLDFSHDLTVDGAGNVLAVGYITTMSGEGWWADGIDIRKFNPSGGTVWSKRISNFGGGADVVATDESGNVIVGGFFAGTVDFNPSPSQAFNVTGSYSIVGGTGQNAFVLQLNENGDFAWVSPLVAKTSSSVVYTHAMDIDDSDNIVVGGSYKGQIDFNPSSQIDYRLPAPAAYAGYVAKLSPTGSLTWATSLGDTSITAGVAADQQTVYATGVFANVFSPNGDISIPSKGGDDFFVAQLSPAGVVQTAVGIGGTGIDSAAALVADHRGGLHTVGVFNGTVDFNPDPLAAHELTNPLKHDLYLLKLITPGFHVTPAAGLVTSEGGATANFTVALQSPPTADVFVPIESSNPAEATVSTSGLFFTPGNWNVPQVVTVTGVDDGLIDGDVAYSIVLGPADSADAIYDGRNPDDVLATNLDDETLPTKFYVVDDASTNRTYEYGATGAAVENYTLGSGNTTPRGAASTAAGDKVWVVDANRKVYVYNASGGLLGSWTAGTLASNATVEGIATNGVDVWIVDANSDKVFKYTGAASRTSGSQNAASSFNLNSSNTSPKDIVTDGTYVWVVNDSSTNKVFKYAVAGSLVGSWTISGANTTPTGITIDPANVSDIWIADSGTDRVYQYTGAASRTSSSQGASSTFALAAGNSNPQGLADPPATENRRGLAQFAQSSEQIVPDPHPKSGSPIGATPKSRRFTNLDEVFASSLGDFNVDNIRRGLGRAGANNGRFLSGYLASLLADDFVSNRWYRQADCQPSSDRIEHQRTDGDVFDNVFDRFGDDRLALDIDSTTADRCPLNTEPIRPHPGSPRWSHV